MKNLTLLAILSYMKRSFQEIIELVIFGLIALLVGTGVLWLAGWLMGILGVVFKFIAGIIWLLLRFIIPIALVVGVIFFLVRLVMNPRKKETPVAAQPEPEAKAIADDVDIPKVEEPLPEVEEIVAEEVAEEIAAEEVAAEEVAAEAAAEAEPKKKTTRKKSTKKAKKDESTDADSSGAKDTDGPAEDADDPAS